MKWMRYILAALFFSLAVSCSDPAGPRYPQEKDDDPDPPPDSQGLVVTEMGAFWA